MHTHDALKALRAAGIDAEVVGSRTVRAGGHELEIFTPRGAPTRADVQRAFASVGPDQRVLIIADKLTPSLSQAALDDERVVVVANDTVVWGQQMMSLAGQQATARKRPTGPRPYGRFAVARALLAVDVPVAPKQLVEDAGVSQANVSKALATKLFSDVLHRTWGQVYVSDRETLFDRVVSEYPGPGGVTTYWWHETPVTQQAQAITTADETALVSGDVAADSISAWRRPEHAVVYTRAEPDLRRLGFTLADPDDYTLMLVHPEDRTIWSTARSWSTERITDPMTASFDVTRTGTLGDQDEAVDRIRNYVIGKRR